VPGIQSEARKKEAHTRASMGITNY